MSISEDIIKDWIRNDPDKTTRRELQHLWQQYLNGDQKAREYLEESFKGNLQFGTAGLRAVMGPGPNKMNRAVVIRAARGICDYALSKIGTGFRVVIGFDARNNSQCFAKNTAEVVSAAGGKVLLFRHPTPTPLTAFGLRYFNADIGIMVTASHNAATYNGYKVYMGGRLITDEGQGAQIVSPIDTEIAKYISKIHSAMKVPRQKSGWQFIGDEVAQEYKNRLLSLGFNANKTTGQNGVKIDDRRLSQTIRRPAHNTLVSSTTDTSLPEAPDTHNLRIVFTPLHGVGGDLFLTVMNSAGFYDIHCVTDQVQPNPDFPTIASPNPEEPGTLDQAIRLAQEVHADIVLALDPDADRCAVAIPTSTGFHNFRQLTGDEVGTLIGEHLCRGLVKHKTDKTLKNYSLASSMVSSQLLQKIAHHHGLKHHMTLTGFKWICRVPKLIYGYEEALGYCIDPDSVRDKDGISAALAIANIALKCKKNNRTINDELDLLAVKYGLHMTHSFSLHGYTQEASAKLMRHLRKQPPTELASLKLKQSFALHNNVQTIVQSDVVLFINDNGDRAIVRPSGTEPKLKCYLETIVPVEAIENCDEARQKAGQQIQRMEADMRNMLAAFFKTN